MQIHKTLKSEKMVGVLHEIRECFYIIGCLFLMFVCSCSSAEPWSRMKEFPYFFFEKTTTTPYVFMKQANTYFARYHDKYKRYPARWAECSEVLFDETEGIREIIQGVGRESRPMVREDYNLVLPDAAVLIAYDRVKDKKYYYKYTVIRSDASGYEIDVESNYFPYVWATDGWHIWHFYKDANEEDRIIDEVNGKILSTFIGERTRRGLMYKLILLKNEKALSCYVSYLEKFKDDSYTVERLLYRMKESSILESHKEYKDNVKAVAGLYPENARIQEFANGLLAAFDMKSASPVAWQSIEEWVYLIPYGRNASDQ